METKKISIIVPVYKVEAYLKKCVESIVNQTYQNIEVILVDDGSPDQCGHICDFYAKIDSRIRVIHKQNGGLSSARNAGISMSTGDYLLFVDSDDWISPRLCENAIQDLEESGADVVIYGFSRIDENEKILENCVAFEPKDITSKEAVESLITLKIDNYAWNKIYKKELFEGIRFPEGRLWEDIGTTYKVLLKSKKIHISNRILYYYLVRNGSITSTPNPQSLLDIFAQRKEQYDTISDIWPDVAQKALPILLVSAVEICDRLGNSKDSVDAKKFLISKKGSINVNNKKIQLYWKNENIFYIMFYIFNKHRSIVKRIKKYYQQLKIAIRPISKKIKILSYQIQHGDHYKISKEDDKARFFLIGTPDHDNLGDHAIALASKLFLNKYGKVYCVSELRYWKYRKSILKQINPNDIVILQGGGNIGNQYKYIEDIRRDAIKTFKHNKKIIFPQTMYFTDNKPGRAEMAQTKKIYTKAENLTIFAREKYSYVAMKELFGETVHIVPDIVLSLPPCLNKHKRSGILFCIRSDYESRLSLKDRLYLEDIVSLFDSDIYYTDTCIKEYCDEDKAQIKISEKLSMFQKTKLVVTDRLHGMVFAALTGTPCLAISNYNKKIEGVYNWIENINNMLFVSDITNREKLYADIRTILDAKSNYKQVLNNLQERYQVLHNEISK